MLDKLPMQQRDNPQEELSPELTRAINEIRHHQRRHDAAPRPIEHAYADRRPNPLRAALHGLTAVIVTFALFTAGLIVLTAPSRASILPVSVELA